MPDRVRDEMTRVYVPTTVEGLELLEASGTLGTAADAYGVTEALVAWWSDGAAARPGDEELEYAATLQAAAASLALLDPTTVANGRAPARRVVIAVDVARLGPADPAPADVPPTDLAPGAVRLPYPLDRADVVSVHVDTADAEHAVGAAVAALADDGAPSSHVEPVLAERVDHDLAWFAPDEVADLLASLR